VDGSESSGCYLVELRHVGRHFNTDQPSVTADLVSAPIWALFNVGYLFRPRGQQLQAPHRLASRSRPKKLVPVPRLRVSHPTEQSSNTGHEPAEESTQRFARELTMPKNHKSVFAFRKIGQLAAVTFVLGLALFTTACGGSSSAIPNPGPGPSPGPAPTPNTVAQVKIGDAPADRVVSFEVTVGPITMTPTSGSGVTVLSGTRRLELTHLSGTNEPLALLNVPQGSYSSASITVSSPEVTFINSLGAIVKLEPVFSQAITVNFSPAITVGANSTVVNIDLNVANSLTFDAQGNVSGVNLSASSFTLFSADVAAEDKQGHDDGELEDTTGTITAVNGDSFTLLVGQNGVSLTFTTDANTQFNDGASLTANIMVTVEGITKSDGTLYAKEVEGIEDASGVEAEGLITQVTGNSATQITFLADDGLGSGMDDTKVGGTITASVGGARYKVNKSNIDNSGIGGLPSLPTFPFDETTVHAGQRIEIESVNSMDGTSVVAEKVKLQQQSLVGTVTALPRPTSAGPVTFTLTVPTDSAFAMLSGNTQITVYWQTGTDLHKLTSVKNGDTVRVRGLIFFTGSSFNMIARRIDQ